MHHAVASVLALLLATVLVDPSCGSTYGRLVNITVDDQATDPTTGQSLIVYSNHFAAGQDCGSDCASRPNPSQAFDETWHDVTYDPGRDDYHNIPQTATFQFNGSAIRAYGIQSQSKTNPYSDAHILFFIDGDNVANYTYIAPGLVGVYTYNQLLFFSGPLEYGSHTLRLQNGYIGGSVSLLLLDYLVYETDLPPPQASSSAGSGGSSSSSADSGESTSPPRSPPGHVHGLSTTARSAIIISVTVVAALSLALVALVLCIRRRRRRQREEHFNAAYQASVPFILTETSVPGRSTILSTKAAPTIPEQRPLLASSSGAQPSADIRNVGRDDLEHAQSELQTISRRRSIGGETAPPPYD